MNKCFVLLFGVFFVFFSRLAQQIHPVGEEGVVVIVLVVLLLWGFACISQKKKKMARNTVSLVHLQEPNHA